MDKLFINNLRVCTTIGVFEWERDIKQTILMDIELDYDISLAAKTDDIGDALDYQHLSDTIIAHVENSAFTLIESLAESVIACIFHETETAHIKLKLLKPGALSDADTVGLCLERSKSI